MTRKITLAILTTLVAALLVVGVGTIVLANARARATTERQLRSQVTDVANRLGEVLDAPPAPDERGVSGEELLRRRLRAARLITRVLNLDDFGVVTIGAQGRIIGELPTSVDPVTLDVTTIEPGQIRSIRSGGQVVVARSVGFDRARLVVVAARRPNPGLGPSVRWFIIAAAMTIALGALVARALGRRLARPVLEASAITQRLAAGDLSARLDPPGPGADDELSELTNSINTMASHLQRSRTVEQQFLLSVSHDLRTPLTSIRGYAEAIADSTGDPQRAAAVIRSESQRLERLVNDLLDLGKLQARSFDLRLASVDLAAVARLQAESVAPEAAELRVSVICNAPLDAPVSGDPDRLAQVVANLLDNALKYARVQVTIDVSVGPLGHGAELTVDDDGPGIPPADLPRVFERLYVARNQAERRESGSGLGLAIVRELVEMMGGTVRADVSALGGARFVVTLPN